ncbi:MAG TPA: DUF2332 domain-containing protein [Actinomycetota bacterium]|nr:DUF2332 domain-containing protein [Actinomycetota bacterium]
MNDRELLVESLARQADACARLGSALYAELLGRVAADVEARGVAWELLGARARDPADSMLSLRMLGAVHRLVLAGSAPELARFYPSAGGREDASGAWGPFRRVLEDHLEDLRAEVGRPVQTNEVGRSAALLGGFLLVVESTGQPLRILEVGASAGLNLRWDRFRYEARGATWGDDASPVRLCGFNTQRLPPFHVAARVVERRGCDPSPLDPASPEGAATLASFVWPDQLERHRNLRAALEVARRVPAPVDEADAVTWVRTQLSERRDGVATVVFHSIVLQYLEEAARAELEDAIGSAGRAATSSAPVAWLCMEPLDADAAGVWLTRWPGGRRRLIARAGYHGPPVIWLA